MTGKKTGAARAIADVTQGLILATVDIAVPPERVYRAITDGAEIAKWWGSDEAYWTKSWVADLRVGGKWRADGEGADGSPFSVQGEFLELDPPRKVVQTWEAAWDGGHTTTITYQLEPITGGTRLSLRHTGFGDRHESCRSHGQGWEAVLGWLKGFAEPKEPQAEDKHWFVRLVAPRPTFAMDMSAEERAMMGEHGAYWRGQLAAGTVIVFGPVLDPEGPWGLGVVRARDEAALKAFQDGDPAIQSGRGFRYVSFPMLAAVYLP